MTTKLTCPECGGVLGPAEPGVSSCICFKSETTGDSALASSGLGIQTGDPHQPEDLLNDTQPVETLSKLCFKCGANVAGQKRYKDSRGYMCADCNKAEIRAEKEGTEQCSECGRRVRVAGLVDFRGMRCCKLCVAELRDADKKKIKVVSSKAYDNQDRRTLKILIVIMIVLAVFIVLSHFKTPS